MEQDNSTDGMPPNIARYQVQASVGFGAMGAVYKAFDPLIKRTLAIKTIRLDIPKSSPQYKSFLERFYHEARISGTLSHPNIVTLFDIGEEAGIPFLAMEYVEGETLASILERGIKFDPERVIGLVSQVAAAIDYAHSRGVIHRDIKPSNLILAEGDRIKVTDFGIAKLVDAEMTQSGALLGTPSYMSPEQAMGDKLDGRSDIFSLGICAFEMLSGEQPFPGNNVTSILYKLVHVDPVQPVNLEMQGLVPQKWHEVFGKVLAKKPDDRYQTASLFVQDLEYCLGSWFGSAMGEEGGATPATVIMPAPALGGAVAAGPEPTTILPTLSPAKSTGARAPIAASAAVPAVAPVPTEEPTLLMRTPAVAAAVATPAPTVEPETIMMKSASEDVTVRQAVPAAVSAPPPASRPAPPPPAPTRRAATIPPPVRPPVPPPPAVAPVPSPVTAPVERPAAPVPPAPNTTVFRDPARRSALPLVLFGAVGLFLVSVGLFAVWKFKNQGEGTAVATPVPPTPTPAVVVKTAAPPVSTAPPALAQTVLHVGSEPAGATVFVDGESKGVTPLDLAGLTIGTHEVRLELTGLETKTQPIDLTAEAPEKTLSVTLTPPAPTVGSADILSTPPGASVFIDGKAAGTSPLSELPLKVGTRRIEIRKDGYLPFAAQLRVGSGKRARLSAELQPEVKVTASPTPKVEVVDLDRLYEETEVETPPKKTKGDSSPHYPDKAPKLKSGETVSTSVSFVVTDTGEVTDIRIMESAGKVVDDEVMKTIRGQRYQPATKKGKAVKVRLIRKYAFQAG